MSVCTDDRVTPHVPTMRWALILCLLGFLSRPRLDRCRLVSDLENESRLAQRPERSADQRLYDGERVGGYHGVAALPDELPKSKLLFVGRGYDAGRIRDALREKRIALHSEVKSPNKIVKHHSRHYKSRDRIAFYWIS